MAMFVAAFGAPQTARAACDPNTEQQVAIGFPGATLKGNTYCVPLNKTSTSITQNPIWVFLRGMLQILAALVGVAVVVGIIIGGFMYMTAQGNAAQTGKAIETIRNAVIGLFLFIFMFAILNFLIPGGILS